MTRGTGDRTEDMRQTRVINSYLAGVQQRRLRAQSVERLQSRLAELNRVLEMDDLTPIQRLYALRDVETLTRELGTAGDHSLEDEFVAVIKDWAERHDITYALLRQMNVPRAVLRRAGFTG